MDIDAMLDGAVARALQAQRAEYDSGFETTNEPLQSLIDEVDPNELLEVGRTLLSSADSDRRVLATRVLREIWDCRAEALKIVVIAVPQEGDDDVLGWLLSAVAFIGDSSALDVVKPFAHHRDPRVRDQAAGAISCCGAPQRSSSALDALIQLADDPNEEVRFSALFELGRWWEDGCRSALIHRRLRTALADEDQRARYVATHALSAVAPTDD